MDDLPEHWRNLVEAARLSVQRAEEGDANAGWSVLAEAVIGLRGLLQLNEPADPHRVVCLHALLKSLERIIESGEDPATALHLRPEKLDHRRPDPNLGFRDVLLFMRVGEELDRLIERGHTRQDGPTAAAIKLVAKEEKVGIATVDQAWRHFGGAAGWARCRSDRK